MTSVGPIALYLPICCICVGGTIIVAEHQTVDDLSVFPVFISYSYHANVSLVMLSSVLKGCLTQKNVTAVKE